jgi:hypothetical protein
MGLVVWGMKSLLPLSRIWTIAEIAVGGAVYLGVALADGALSRKDIAAFLKRR